MWHEVKLIVVYCLIWYVWALTQLLCFCRWQLAQRPEWDGVHRPCLVPAASARAGSPLSGVWTLPQRKKQKPIPVSTRSARFYSFKAINRTALATQRFLFSLYLKHLSSTVLLKLWPLDLLFVPAGLCWWWRASEKACRWHICWSCQGTHSKEESFSLLKLDSEV